MGNYMILVLTYAKESIIPAVLDLLTPFDQDLLEDEPYTVPCYCPERNRAECAMCSGRGEFTTEANKNAKWWNHSIGYKALHAYEMQWGIHRMPALELADEIDGNRVPFEKGEIVPGLVYNKLAAVLMPDGTWHERGKITLWARIEDEKPVAEWADEVIALLRSVPDATAVPVALQL